LLIVVTGIVVVLRIRYRASGISMGLKDYRIKEVFTVCIYLPANAIAIIKPND
jgi:hypothetical protein